MSDFSFLQPGKSSSQMQSKTAYFFKIHCHLKFLTFAGAKICFADCQEEVDAGGIVTQEAVAVIHGDTVQTLQERVKVAEHKAYPRAMELLASGRIKLNEQGKVQWMW